MSTFVVLEGPDGVGKSTVAERLADHLVAHGAPTDVLGFPGNTPGTLGRLVYEVHHRNLPGIGDVAPVALQLLHIAAHIDAIQRVIRPKLESGTNVILDRFWWSTVVYGSAAGGISLNLLRKMVAVEQHVWAGTKPGLIVLLLPPEPYRKELPDEQYGKMVSAYMHLRNESSEPVVVVDQQMSVHSTVKLIMGRLNGF